VTNLAFREILTLGNPILRKKSEEVDLKRVKKRNFQKLLMDMFNTMKENSGAGLSAPQIGISLKFFVMGFDDSERYPDEKPLKKQVIINPEIKFLTEETMDFWEGCLSIPKMQGLVRRPKEIEVSYYDENLEHHKKIIIGFEAIVFQHEFDHLDGILYIDRLVSTKQFGYNDNFKETEVLSSTG